MLATDISQENLPLVVEELGEGLFVGVTDRGELNGVETELLKITKRQVPTEISDQIVKSDTW